MTPLDPSCPDRLTRPAPWRLRRDGPLPGFANMEADEALLESQKDPAAIPVLRFFRWERKTLSYGRLQDAHHAANQAMILGAGSAVRRPTGGGSVLHDKDLSLSLVWRRDHPAFPRCLRNIYRAVHDAVRAALSSAGIEASFYSGPKAAGEGLCFSEPAEDDLMWKGKKVLGGALKVSGWGRLYQGNLLTAEVDPGADWEPRLIRAFEEEFFRTPPEAGPAGT